MPNAACMGPYGRDVETPKMGVFLIERPDEHCNSVASWSWSPEMATARHGDERRNVPVHQSSELDETRLTDTYYSSKAR